MLNVYSRSSRCRWALVSIPTWLPFIDPLALIQLHFGNFYEPQLNQGDPQSKKLLSQATSILICTQMMLTELNSRTFAESRDSTSTTGKSQGPVHGAPA